MRKLIIAFLLLFPCALAAQNKPLRIVFDVTSKDTVTHNAVLRHVKGMAKAYPDAQLEVVVYGGALPMVLNGKSSGQANIEQLSTQNNIAFKVCGITMKRAHTDPSQLIKGVEVVPDAIVQIVQRQGEGWGYIKESHN
jgi:intracellular sulfur oxidation DsrE/DsrF family protein